MAGKLRKRAAALFLSFAMIATLVPTAFAAEPLYDDQYLVSETAHVLAPGITEYNTISNNAAGTNQHIDFYCEVDPKETTAMVMAGYPNYDGSSWALATVMDQAKAAQKNFDERNLGYKVVGIINADFYNMTTGQPSGALVMEGKEYNPANGRTYFAVLKDGTAVIRTGDISMADVETAVGGAGFLVKDGELAVSQESNQLSVSRTAIGVKADGTIVALVNRGKNYPISMGCTSYDIAQMMKARGCKDAMLLDGSGSSSFASMRAGDTEVVLRNSPSDGSARHVSDSLMFVTKAVSDGEFDHATIQPNNEVYTPGTEIKFDYVAVDASNAPVEKPSDLIWRLKEGSVGTVDANGTYTADAIQTGDVTVQLVNSNGEVKGESTILIQNPDEIKFGAETASIGFGETSNLGLTVSYLGREIHYKDGDFTWKIEPTEFVRKNRIHQSTGPKDPSRYETLTVTDPEEMKNLKLGEVVDNQLTCTLEYLKGRDQTEKRAATASAKITVTSVGDPNVSGVVRVEAGKEPASIMNFEDVVNPDGTVINAAEYWTIGQINDDSNSRLVTSNYGKGGTVSAELASRAEGYPVHTGSHSLKLNYSFNDSRFPEKGVSGTEGACFGFRDARVIEGNPTAIGAWVYVPEGTPNYWFRMQYKDGSGRQTQLDFTLQYKDAQRQDPPHVGGLAPYADNSWHYFEADLKGIQTPITIPAGMIGRLMVVPAEGNFCGKYLADGSILPVAEREGSIYIDDIMFIYGSNPNDTKQPDVTSFTVNEQPITDNMTINTNELNLYATYQDSGTIQDTGIDHKNTFLYIDGNRLTDALVDQSGNFIRRDSVILPDGVHTIHLLVTDNSGNELNQEYTVQVQGGGSIVSPVVVDAIGTPKLNQTFELALTSDIIADIQSVDLSLMVDKIYRTHFNVVPVEGFKLTKEAEYDPVHRTINLKLERTNEEVSGNELCRLKFDIPSDLRPNSKFMYCVEKGAVTYQPSYQQQNMGAFGGTVTRLPIEVAYHITSDCFIANYSDPTYFYIKDAEGKPVSNIELQFAGADGTKIGTSDAEGKIAYNPKESGTVSVQAPGTFAYTATVNKAQGDSTGKPEMILHSAVGDILTQRTITWTSNPLHAALKAEMKLSEKQDMSNSTTYTGKSELLEFVSDTSVVIGNAVEANGLKPGTTYYYQVGDGEVWSDVSSFVMPSGEWTAPKKILIMGDIQDPDTEKPKQIIAAASEDLSEDGFGLLIQTGDLVDNGGSYMQRKKAYDQVASLGDINRLYAIGNHETYGDSDAGISHFLNHSGDKGYYTVSYGDVYLAVMDYGVDYNKALAAISEEAKTINDQWKILITHQPAYYTNTAGGNADIHEILPDYAEAGGFDLVLSGHDHSYARTLQLTNNEEDVENGVTYVISGAVGEKGYPISDAIAHSDRFVKRSDSFDSAYLVMDIDNRGITITANEYTDDGEIAPLDQFTIGCIVHDMQYDLVKKQLTCRRCGTVVEEYTGIVPIVGRPDAQAYLYLGEPKTGWFVYNDGYLHAGEDGVLHTVEQHNVPSCTEHWYKSATCKTCGKTYQGSRLNPVGHDWDEQHICKRCAFKGIDISTLDISLNAVDWSWNGQVRRPVVTVKDGEKILTRATQIGSGIGEYYLTYPSDSEIGKKVILVDGMLDYYGKTQLNYNIVPPMVKNLKVDQFDSTSAVLSWEPAHGATYYRVSLYDENKGGYYFQWKTQKPALSLDNLIPGREYKYRVRAYAEVDGNTYAARSSSYAVVLTPPGAGACQNVEHQFVSTPFEAGCVMGSGVRHICSACGASYTEINSNPNGHTSVVVPAVEPTCTTEGKTEGAYCSVCAEVLKQQEVVDALGHNVKGYTYVDEENHSGICEVCNGTVVEAHLWDGGKVVKQATYTQKGLQEYTCTVCKGTKVVETPVLSSGGGGGSWTPTYSVNAPGKVKNGTVTVTPGNASKGDTVTITATPDKGFVIDTVSVTDKHGKEIKVTLNRNDKHTFSMPASEVYIKVNFKEESPVTHSFNDVAKDAWYADAVQYVFKKGLMSGVSEANFAPEMQTSRAMIVTVLYRFENEPAIMAENSFNDVGDKQWYTNAICWAAENGIVNGYSATKFGPDDSITREQMAAILYRYATFKNYDKKATADLGKFTDVSEISEWAVEAMRWANTEGLINGTSGKMISPNGDATRAQVAAILMRFCQNVAG